MDLGRIPACRQAGNCHSYIVPITLVDPSGFEPLISSLQMRRSSQLNYGPLFKFINVGTEGVEPSTSSLSEKRSTAELCAQNFSAESEGILITEPCAHNYNLF